MVVCAQTPTKKKSPIDPNKHAVIINGAGGEAEYAKQFEQWTTELSSVLSDRYGFDSKQVKVLTEKPADATIARSTAEEVKRTFATQITTRHEQCPVHLYDRPRLLRRKGIEVQSGRTGSVGYRIQRVARSLPTRRVVVFNMASASGEFIKSLAVKGRIVVTATRSGQETNATRFAGFFIAALNATDSDTDQDGHTSVLEAFVYANRLTGDFYKRAGLASEHALIDDNGDGVGHDKVGDGEGLLARATYLDSLSVEDAAASVATAKLLKERVQLEGEIEQLIARKGNMPEAEYEANLERLFVQLAKINRSIKQAGS